VDQVGFYYTDIARCTGQQNISFMAFENEVLWPEYTADEVI